MQVRDRDPAGVDRAQEVGGDDAVYVLEWLLVEGGAAANAGGCEEVVDGAEVCGDLLEDCFKGWVVCYVSFVELGLDAAFRF